MKLIILIFLITFAHIYTKFEQNRIEFDVETSFDDKDNNKLSFYYDNTINPLIMKINRKTKNSKISCNYPGHSITKTSHKTGIDYSGLSAVIGTYDIEIESGKGNILIHPMNQTIKIDFSQKCYGIDYILLFDNNNGSLTYLVSNLKDNKTVKFTYKDSENNPFKVCHGIECVTDVKEYTFKKGEEYIIEVNIQENKDKTSFGNFLPAFSICSNNSLNLKINLFILLFLLLMIFYH